MGVRDGSAEGAECREQIWEPRRGKPPGFGLAPAGRAMTAEEMIGHGSRPTLIQRFVNVSVIVRPLPRRVKEDRLIPANKFLTCSFASGGRQAESWTRRGAFSPVEDRSDG